MVERYIISDASKMLKVEAHVLRYWEEELGLEIPRNEMGHRYYTKEHIEFLKNVKELKDKGYGLKTINVLLMGDKGMSQNIPVTKTQALSSGQAQSQNQKPDAEEGGVPAQNTPSNEVAHQSSVIADSKMEEFQRIMVMIVSKALKQNSDELGKNISDSVAPKVTENVIKEMNYLIREKEEREEKREEERYRKLDEAIRKRQKVRKEIALTDSNAVIKKRFGIWKRKK